MVAQYDPSGHVLHALDPVEAWYAPARQLEQLVEDADDEYLPVEQLEQTVEEETENEPAAQAPVTMERPAVAQNDPPGQAAHAEDPVAT